jgi:hypothetical protein
MEDRGDGCRLDEPPDTQRSMLQVHIERCTDRSLNRLQQGLATMPRALLPAEDTSSNSRSAMTIIT